MLFISAVLQRYHKTLYNSSMAFVSYYHQFSTCLLHGFIIFTSLYTMLCLLLEAGLCIKLQSLDAVITCTPVQCGYTRKNFKKKNRPPPLKQGKFCLRNNEFTYHGLSGCKQTSKQANMHRFAHVHNAVWGSLRLTPTIEFVCTCFACAMSYKIEYCNLFFLLSASVYSSAFC